MSIAFFRSNCNRGYFGIVRILTIRTENYGVSTAVDQQGVHIPKQGKWGHCQKFCKQVKEVVLWLFNNQINKKDRHKCNCINYKKCGSMFEIIKELSTKVNFTQVLHVQNQICDKIEQRRIELGKTSGFERLYHKVVAHYFGGMRLHLRALRPKLKRSARLAYVVGDQLSFLMVPVATAQLLGEVAEAEGFSVVGCDLWRERIGTKVRNDLANRRTVKVREEILLLKLR